ncbi:MAG TPA: hypothetical protein PKD85_20865, partial [Saprospiraceae bacterium]|nr:hypothetical protein [Saprospiraceae bacterium]
IGYNIPSRVASKLKMESFRVFSSIQQPFIFADYIRNQGGVDPETFVDGETGVGGGDINSNISPAIRTMTIGVNIRF